MTTTSSQQIPPDVTFISLGAEINRLMQEHQVPGVAVGVLYNGQTYTAGFGVNNINHSLPITDTTLFQIGSITKTFVGTLLMRMVEENMLDLDAPVISYLPEFRVQDEKTSDEVTIRHLLTHTAGWVGDFFIDTGEGDDATEKYVDRMAVLPQIAPLGTHYSYNNAGFYLCGHIVEAIFSYIGPPKTFEQAMREMVFKPWDLAHCYLTPTDVMVHRFATGHRTGEQGAEVMTPWPLPRACQAAGGIITNVRTLLGYTKKQMDVENHLLSAESVQAMQSPQHMLWGEKESVGLSWHINDTHGVRVISHTGGTVGQISLLAMIPERDFALVVLTNSMAGRQLNPAAFRWALRHYLGIEPVMPKKRSSSAFERLQYTGTFSRPLADMKLTLENGQLILYQINKGGFPTEDTPPAPSPEPAACDLCGKDRLLVCEGDNKGTVIDVIRHEDGSIGWIRVGRLYAKVKE
ncbi:MAG: serine hydrolase domain-containing protein [Chloroflexota bacterium]